MNNWSGSPLAKTRVLSLQLRAKAELERRRRSGNLNLKSPTFTFRGAMAQIQAFAGPQRPREFLLSGPSETGKTIGTLKLLDTLARTYPNARGAIIRKSHVDMSSTVLDIFKREFVAPAGDIRIHGGEEPKFYQYPNRTRIWVAGIDRPGKVLSGALDFVYANQAEELAENDWQTLSTRTTGRAEAMVPGLLFGDCNPGPPTHWILSRAAEGSLLKLDTTHRDNPSLFDDAGNLTERGISTMETLSKLTGTLGLRLRDGLWVEAEGIVYDTWRDPGNVTEDAEYVPEGGPVYWLCDDGYSAGSAPQSAGLDKRGNYVADAHPRVFLFAQLKHDGHLDVFNESYACLKLTDVHINECIERSKEKGYALPQTVTHGPGAAEFRGRIFAASLHPFQYTGQVDPRIKELRSALAADKNDWRKVRVHPRCKHLRSEMVSYAFEPGSKDKPVKAFDHGPDALSYGNWILRYQR